MIPPEDADPTTVEIVDHRKSYNLSMKMTQEMHAGLAAAAQHRDVTVSTVVRWAIADYLKRNPG